jgi:hypothetical protein
MDGRRAVFDFQQESHDFVFLHLVDRQLCGREDEGEGGGRSSGSEEEDVGCTGPTSVVVNPRSSGGGVGGWGHASSSSFKILAKYCASSALKKGKFLTPGILVGNSGASPAAAAAAAAASEPSWIGKPPASVIGVAISFRGATIGAYAGGRGQD